MSDDTSLESQYGAHGYYLDNPGRLHTRREIPDGEKSILLSASPDADKFIHNLAEKRKQAKMLQHRNKVLNCRT